MTARGVPISQIEEYIDELPLNHEELSALWLLAWAWATNPAIRRQAVAELSDSMK